MQEVIKEYLEHIKIGRKQVHKNLALFPLLSDYTTGLEYILLDEALGAGLVEVREIHDQGLVPESKELWRSGRKLTSRTIAKDVCSRPRYTELLQ